MKRAKTSKKKDTKADQYEVSLGTESDDSDDFNDPDWYKRTPRSYLQGRLAGRTATPAARRGGRSPPGPRLQSRNNSRKNSVDDKDL